MYIDRARAYGNRPGRLQYIYVIRHTLCLSDRYKTLMITLVAQPALQLVLVYYCYTLLLLLYCHC